MKSRTMCGTAAITLVCGVFAGTAAAKTLPAYAGPVSQPKLKLLDFDAFFPTTVKVHVGDSIKWALHGFHNVAFLAPSQTAPPLIIPATSNPITGPLDAAGSAFWFKGQPNLQINPVVAFPAGGTTEDGTAYLNSGIPLGPSGPKSFTVKFTKLGRFTLYCLVHPGMTGKVQVVAKNKAIPTAAQDKAAAKAEQATATKTAVKLAKVKPAPAVVLAGNDSGPVAWLRFFPSSLSVKAGTTVHFKMAGRREVHTFTIGPAPYIGAIDNTFVTPVPNVAGPPSILLNPLGAYPSDPPPLPPFTGANHGNGFEGTGILALGSGPNPSSASITFTKAGTYHYECVIHQGMDGTITVT